MSQMISAAGMVAPSIIQPLRPNNADWYQMPFETKTGYPIECWMHDDGFIVLSAVEVINDLGQGPEYHISCSKEVNRKKVRCDTNEAKWILSVFGLEGAEEDNHVPNGFVRNFWRPVAEPMVGIECPCKDDEPVIKENKGDFVWRPVNE